jgi:dienelactone hydrolase
VFSSLNSIANCGLSLLLAAGGSAPLPRGQVVETLAAARDPSQTYALYLPTGYDPAHPAPILYLLDPRGRALVPIERFRAGAEALGVVLASSYRSRSDEKVDPNLPALRALWADTHERLVLDDREVYLGGFSGTARVSCLLADLSPGSIAGVIGAGAGFSSERPPRRDTPFLFFGSVGDADFNYGEVQELDEKLAEVGLRYRIEIVPGPHDWMPEEVATAALRWMRLYAKGGGREGSAALVEAGWERDFARARSLETAGRPFEARRQWAWMARDFAGRRDVQEAQAREKALEKAAAHDEAERRARLKRETREVADAQRILAAALTSEEFWPLRRVAGAMDVDALRKRAEADTEDGRSARRVLSSIQVQTAFYLPREANERGDRERAALLLEVATAIRPDDPQLWYRLAAAQSRAGHSGKAVQSLHRAVTLGFTDGRRLAGDGDFERLRADPEFRRIVAGLDR